ncbi:MAG: acyl carrier protein [Vicinamibacterales bacterium]
MDVRQRFQRVFREVFDNNSIEVTDAMSAADVEEWDSLSHVQLVMALEKEFQLRFTTDEIIDLKNVGEFMALVTRKKG